MKRPIRTRVNALAIAASMVLLISSHTANAQNVGIGTPTPGSKLSVAGNAVIGSGYAGLVGPTDGLAVQGRVGIGTPTPAGDAGLDINFTDKGLLIPRVSLTNTGTYGLTGGGPTTSMLVYNTNAGISGTGAAGEGFYYWNGTRWVKLLAANTPSDAWLTLGNAGTTPGTHFIGTTDNKDLVCKTNNTEWMRILSNGNVGIGTAAPSEKLELLGGGIQLNDEYGIGFRSALPYNGNVLISPDAAKIYYDINFDGVTQDFDFLVIEKTDVNRADPDGGIAFTNKGNDNVREIAMVIRGNGNVGIGTTTPAGPLHIAKVVDAGPNSPDGSASFMIGPPLGYHMEIDDNEVHAMNNTAGATLYLNPHGGNVCIGTDRPVGKFYVCNDSVGGDSSFVILNNGNVGIGTRAPKAKLSVIGTRQASISPSNSIFQMGGGDVFLYGGALNGGSWAVMLQAMRDWDSVPFPLALQPNGGNVGIGTTAPGNILTIAQNSATDPIADAWTTYSTPNSKIVLGIADDEAMNYLEIFKKLPVYKWKRTKNEQTRLSAIATESAPKEILAYDANGNIQGIDLQGYIGFLHEVMKAQNKETEALKEILKAQQEKIEELVKEVEELKNKH